MYWICEIFSPSKESSEHDETPEEARDDDTVPATPERPWVATEEGVSFTATESICSREERELDSETVLHQTGKPLTYFCSRVHYESSSFPLQRTSVLKSPLLPAPEGIGTEGPLLIATTESTGTQELPFPTIITQSSQHKSLDTVEYSSFPTACKRLQWVFTVSKRSQVINRGILCLYCAIQEHRCTLLPRTTATANELHVWINNHITAVNARPDSIEIQYLELEQCELCLPIRIHIPFCSVRRLSFWYLFMHTFIWKKIFPHCEFIH